jgi:hypothetical protein
VFTAIANALKQDDVVDGASAAAAIRKQTAVQVPGGTLVRWQDGYAIWDPHIVGLTDDGKFQELTTYSAADLSG